MDINTRAFKIVQQSTGEAPVKDEPAMARRGHARAAALTQERRSEIAKKAAKARWKKTQKA
jgi:hypothetical protein